MNKTLIFLVLATLTVAISSTIQLKPHHGKTTTVKILKFSYSNCGSTSDPTVIKSLSVSPNPIVLGDNITVTGTAYLSQTVSNTSGLFSATIALYKYVFGVPVYIPCVDGVGSCPIADICSKMQPNSDCPLAPYGIPCSCPFPQGNYVIGGNGVSIKTHDPNVSWLTEGDYDLEGTLFNPSGSRLACYSISVSLSSAN